VSTLPEVRKYKNSTLSLYWHQKIGNRIQRQMKKIFVCIKYIDDNQKPKRGSDTHCSSSFLDHKFTLVLLY